MERHCLLNFCSILTTEPDGYFVYFKPPLSKILFVINWDHIIEKLPVLGRVGPR